MWTVKNIAIWGALVLAVASRALADSTRMQEAIREFDVGSGAWNVASLTNAAALFERVAASDARSAYARYWRGVALFHAALCWQGQSSDAASADAARALDSAAESLESALALNEADAESHALLSTIQGMRIASQPSTALWRGPVSQKHRRLALQLDPNNPRTHYLVGMSALRAPSFFGGKKEGLKSLLAAERLFAAEADKPMPPETPRWGLDHCLTFIGQAYVELGEPAKAEEYYSKALAINPMNALAKKGLAQCRSSEQSMRGVRP